MSIVAMKPKESNQETSWVEAARRIGANFAARAAQHDAADTFVAENFAELRASELLAAGVPVQFGGGGASHADLCAMVSELARHCSSTALAFAMHTHQVAVNAWRWQHAQAPVEGLLRRVAAERLILLSSGGSDWLHGSGIAERVEGGFRIRGRKVFTSAAPAGDLLMTSAVFEDPAEGPTVLHFALPMNSPAVRIGDNWRVLGMRGTGSQDVEIDGYFLPDAAVGGRRPQGKWHPLFHIISMLAIPLIYSAYAGVAEAARELALRQAGKRRLDAHLLHTVGDMENSLGCVRMAMADMITAGAGNAPGASTTNRVFIARSLLARSAIATVEHAMQVGGGTAFFRSNALERLFRDAQGARYHPLPDGVQQELAARVALGLNIDGD